MGIAADREEEQKREEGFLKHMGGVFCKCKNEELTLHSTLFPSQKCTYAVHSF